MHQIYMIPCSFSTTSKKRKQIECRVFFVEDSEIIVVVDDGSQMIDR